MGWIVISGFFACEGSDYEMSFIKVEALNKSFKVVKKENGLINSIRSFFNRKYEVINAINNVSFSI